MIAVHATAAFDYVIVGGGTAGCVLAARLSEDPTVRVLLLEAGPKSNSLWIRMPAGMGRLFVNPKYNWGYLSQPEAHLNQRAMYVPQGKTLGGSSAINGMAYVRGQAADYDQWQGMGNNGWAWSDVLPYFNKSEHRVGSVGGQRGRVGPLSVSDPSYRHPSAQAFVDAGVRLGLPLNDDFNGDSQEGISFLQYSIDKGRRHSAADAYLQPARARPNLAVETEVFVHRVEIRDRRAVAVEYVRDGVMQRAVAAREVIVAAGTFGSPRVLMHSGIGPAAHLRELDIAVAQDLPGVGENLIDHPYVHMTYATLRHSSLNAQLRGWRVMLHGLRWLLQGTGPLTIGASQAVAFVRGLADASRPDLQINFRPISFQFDSSGRLAPDRTARITAAICGLRPESRGRVRLTSNDPQQPPAIQCNFLSAPRDEDTLVAGVRWARRIFQAEPLRSRVVSEDAPGAACSTENDIRTFIRSTTQTTCHPVGTCRMGADAGAVVDDHLRVRGIEALRVIDASVMPMIVSGNTAAATFMIAEKGADLIKAAAAAHRA